MRNIANLAITALIDPDLSLTGRETDLSSFAQLQQKAPAGHIFQTTGGGTPIPEEA